MVRTGSRLYLALAAFALLGAVAYGLASGGDPLGVVSMGFKGGVGDHFGYAVLATLGATALVLGLFNQALGDVDPDAVEAVVPTDDLPQVAAPRSASPFPLLGAFSLVVIAFGLVVDAGLVALGGVLLVITVVEWAVKAWADRATGDPEVNLAIRNRLMAPVEVPVAAVLVIAFLVLGMSRVFLAVSATGAVAIATALMFVIVAGAVAVMRRPERGTSVATALLLVGALAIIGGGIAGVVAGEREFHHEEHDEEPHEEPEGTSEEAPAEAPDEVEE